MSIKRTKVPSNYYVIHPTNQSQIEKYPHTQVDRASHKFKDIPEFMVLVYLGTIWECGVIMRQRLKKCKWEKK